MLVQSRKVRIRRDLRRDEDGAVSEQVRPLQRTHHRTRAIAIKPADVALNRIELVKVRATDLTDVAQNMESPGGAAPCPMPCAVDGRVNEYTHPRRMRMPRDRQRQ